MDSPLTEEEKAQQIREELEEWRKMGVNDPDKVIVTNSFIEQVKLIAMLRLFIEKEVITDDEFQAHYHKALVDSLKQAREGYMEYRRAQLMVPKMVIPKGKLN